MSNRTQTIVVYTLTEAAKVLGVSRWTLHRAIKDGKLPSHKSGNVVLIFPVDLLDYVLRYRGGQGIPRG